MLGQTLLYYLNGRGLCLSNTIARTCKPSNFSSKARKQGKNEPPDKLNMQHLQCLLQGLTEGRSTVQSRVQLQAVHSYQSSFKNSLAWVSLSLAA